MIKEMACIVCPMSCHLKIELNEKNEVLSITGNTCERGKNYAQNELTHPMRMLTSTVKLKNAIYCRLPVITSKEIPKEKVFDVIKEINQIEVTAPIKINDKLIENVCGLGVDIIASRSIERVN